MKEILQQYASFNAWANERLLQTVLSLTEEQQHRVVESSFKNLYLTFLHIWDVESIWWQRIRLQEHVIIPSETIHPDMQEVASGLMNQSRQWEQWVQKANEHSLEHVFAYYNNRKEYFKNPVWQALMHLFNDGTYHRGQVVTILHYLKVKKIPTMDFMAWVTKK